jgi:hypothetical protein
VSAFPCDEGAGHEWRMVADVGELETHHCRACGLTKLIDKETREETVGLVVLNEDFRRDDEREQRLAQAILKR